MASYDVELLRAARQLLLRRPGLRGKLPGAAIRRSVSTSYYALFHFMLEEIGLSIVGTKGSMRVRRRMIARTISHRGVKLACERITGKAIDPSYVAYFGIDPDSVPRFARLMAQVLVDAQAKRHDADYDLNTKMSEADARILSIRVGTAIRRWQQATTLADRNFKKALCLLILLKGQLRTDN